MWWWEQRRRWWMQQRLQSRSWILMFRRFPKHQRCLQRRSTLSHFDRKQRSVKIVRKGRFERSTQPLAKSLAELSSWLQRQLQQRPHIVDRERIQGRPLDFSQVHSDYFLHFLDRNRFRKRTDRTVHTGNPSKPEPQNSVLLRHWHFSKTHSWSQPCLPLDCQRKKNIMKKLFWYKFIIFISAEFISIKCDIFFWLIFFIFKKRSKAIANQKLSSHFSLKISLPIQFFIVNLIDKLFEVILEFRLCGPILNMFLIQEALKEKTSDWKGSNSQFYLMYE